MTWRTAVLVALVLASSTGPAPAADTVKLSNQANGQESGVIAWGDVQPAPVIGTDSVSVGALGAGTANQLAAFTIDRPPALDARVAWTAGDDVVTLTYPPAYEIPIKFWILCADAGCTDPVTPAQEADLAGFLVWANELLRAERVGLSLVPAGGDAWISDQTAWKDPKGKKVLNVTSKTCASQLDAAARYRLKRAGAFNVYMVRRVDKKTSNGNSCGTDDSAVVGYEVSWGTMLHELGHDLSLGHTNPYPWFADVGGTKNLMCKNSSDRRYLTEGQVFRMHFSTHSGLNGRLSSNLPASLPPNRIPRDCADSTPDDLPCPPEETLLWTDP